MKPPGRPHWFGLIVALWAVAAGCAVVGVVGFFVSVQFAVNALVLAGIVGVRAYREAVRP